MYSSPSTALFRDQHQDNNNNSTSSSAHNNPFVRTVWVRRLGVDAFSALPIHVKADYASVADLLLAAHKLLYTKKDCVAASDVELTTESGIPLSNLDSLEVLAAFRRKEMLMEQQQQRSNQQQHHQQLQQQHITTNNSSNHNHQDAVDMMLIVRRRHQQQRFGAYATSPLVEAVLMQDPKLQQQMQMQARAQTPTKSHRSGVTPSSTPTAAATTTPTSTRSARLRREATDQQQQQQQQQSLAAVKKSSRATTPTASARKKPQNQQSSTPNNNTKAAADLNTPQGKAIADARDAARAQLFPPTSSFNNPTFTSASRQQSTVVPVLTSPNTNTRRRASPSRQEMEDAVLQCKEFSAKWLQEQVCDNCNRPKRLHTLEAINAYEEKLKRHQSPTLSSKHNFSNIFLERHRSTPLWKPKKITPKLIAEANPLSCQEFIAMWGREQFCQTCHGAKKEHSRAVLEAFEEKHRVPPHDPSCGGGTYHHHHNNNNNNNFGNFLSVEILAQRPLLHSIANRQIDISDQGFEERREHRRLAQAARCDAFVPLWNQNKFCAICFQPESAHAVEKRYFNFPSLSFKDKLIVLGSRPDYLTTQYQSSLTAKNWWLVNVPWRHIVVFLPLEDLFSLSSAERWLCVEIRPLLHSALTMIVQNGVTAHYDLRQDAVRLSSHLEQCSGEIRSMIARVMDGVFHAVSHQQQHPHDDNHQGDDSAAAADGVAVDTTTCEPIIVGGTVGSRSALLRKFSRLAALEGRKMQNRKIVLETLASLEQILKEAADRQQQQPPVAAAKSSSSTQHFQSSHAFNACSELVKILRRTETQHEICRRSRRYLDQEYLPL